MASPQVVLNHEGNRLFGIDAELFLKMEAKRDRGRERRILTWVQTVLEEDLADLDNVHTSLKTGVLLCKLINKLKPGTIKKFAKTRLMPLTERANIEEFLQACIRLGVPQGDVCGISDLYSQKDLNAVYQTLFSLQVSSSFHILTNLSSNSLLIISILISLSKIVSSLHHDEYVAFTSTTCVLSCICT